MVAIGRLLEVKGKKQRMREKQGKCIIQKGAAMCYSTLTYSLCTFLRDVAAIEIERLTGPRTIPHYIDYHNLL